MWFKVKLDKKLCTQGKIFCLTLKSKSFFGIKQYNSLSEVQNRMSIVEQTPSLRVTPALLFYASKRSPLPQRLFCLHTLHCEKNTDMSYIKMTFHLCDLFDLECF